MRFWIAFLVWAVLFSPAANLGLAWDSSLMRGPQVTVHFDDTPRTGFYVYKMDGTEWLVDAHGTQYRMNGTEVMSSSQHLVEGSVDVWKKWRRWLPVCILTGGFWLFVAAPLTRKFRL